MKYESCSPDLPNYNDMMEVPEILILNNEQMQVAFILSSSVDESEDIYGITHAHDNFELQYVAENDFEIIIDNTRKLLLHKGDLLLLPPHTYHKVCSKAHDCKRYCINFSILPSQKIPSKDESSTISLREHVLSSVKQEFVFQNEEIQHFVLKIFETNTESNSSISKNKLYLNVIFEELLSYLSNQDLFASLNTSSIDDVQQIDIQRKWTIEKYVSHYYMHRNHTENLSQILALSPRHASRVIKELMGCTLKEMVLTQKMMVAMEYIKFTNMSLAHISDTLGYSTYYGFYTAFCKYFEISPEQACKRFR